MQKRRIAGKTRTKPKRFRDPLTLEELLLRENVPPTKALPKDLAEQFASARISISSRGELRTPTPPPEIVRTGNGWQLKLPQNTFAGIRGQSLARVKPGSHSSGGRKQAHIAPYQPPWTTRVYHPKLSLPSKPVGLRRHGGQRVQPCMQGVFGKDDRVIIHPDGYPQHCVGKIFSGNSLDGLTCLEQVP